MRRNAEYASAIALARTVVERRPTAVAHHILGEQLALAGQTAEAETALRAAVLARRLAGALSAGRAADERAAACPRPPTQLEAFVATAGVPQRLRWLDPPLLDVLTARLQLAQIYGAGRRWADVAAQARLVLEVVPRHPEAQRLLGAALFGTQSVARGHRDAAGLSDAAAGRRAHPHEPGRGARSPSGRLDEAVPELRRAAAIDPNDPKTRRLLDLALADQRAQARRPRYALRHDQALVRIRAPARRGGVRGRLRAVTGSGADRHAPGHRPPVRADDERRRGAVARAAGARARRGSGPGPAAAEDPEGRDGRRRGRRLGLHEPAAGADSSAPRGASTPSMCSRACCSCCSRTPPRRS